MCICVANLIPPPTNQPIEENRTLKIAIEKKFKQNIFIIYLRKSQQKEYGGDDEEVENEEKKI